MTTNNKKQNHIVDNDDPFIGRRGGKEMNEKPKIVERTCRACRVDRVRARMVDVRERSTLRVRDVVKKLDMAWHQLERPGCRASVLILVGEIEEEVRWMQKTGWTRMKKDVERRRLSSGAIGLRMPSTRR